ncbi:uncharacterized protein BCR38DRAFT_344704 [Pseudomassariella vexata]|uniref:Uncharacterized protein n=1 Tax=Pseudomassariella vexata TaxID=1141098 RepID=A0A1Y2DV39_9PEZI|nr:uncharacterized protein BCR38DRAFT_344704 [Pseudomassariella vexata]ORY63152.1 hypothetical protein BCR38DRAFT_344704 [Pseudomassariella vexata]
MAEVEAWQTVLVSLLVICALIGGSYVAYEQGMLDPLIEKLGVMMFKAKAKAEQEKMEAQGKDYMDSQLKGNKQASEVLSGDGPIGSLKKQL